MKTFITIATWAVLIWSILGLANMMQYPDYYNMWSYLFAILIIAQSITTLIYLEHKK